MPITYAPPTQYAQRIVKELNEQGLSISDLQEMLGTTYEHARKIVKGASHASKHVRQKIAELLGVPFEELEKLDVADRIRKNYGSLPTIIAGKHPEVEPFERIILQLDEPFREMYLAMGRNLLHQQQRMRVDATVEAVKRMPTGDKRSHTKGRRTL
jgi:transcriptional regulator with XRE-family HTH domain